MATPQLISKADKALLERAVAAGCKAVRDEDGRILALLVKRVRMSANDCKRLREMIDESNAELLANGGNIVATPSPANLIDGATYYFLKPTPKAQQEDVIRLTRFTRAKERIAELKRHVELHETAEKLALKMPKEEGWLDGDLRAIVPSDPFWSDLAYTELLAVAYDAAPRVIRDDRRQAAAMRGAKKGGRAKAKNASVTWREEAVSTARKLLASGKPRRNLAGILAKRFGKSSRIVRDLLKKAEI